MVFFGPPTPDKQKNRDLSYEMQKLSEITVLDYSDIYFPVEQDGLPLKTVLHQLKTALSYKHTDCQFLKPGGKGMI